MWTVEFLGAGIVQCKWLTLSLFCSLGLREAEVICSILLSDTVHGASHGEWALCVPHHCMPTLGAIPESPLMCFSTEKRWQKKRRCLLEDLCKDLWPLCCGSWVLMVVGSISWSCLVPPKHGTEIDDNLIMGNEHILSWAFHLFCTLPLHSALDSLCVRGYFGFSLLWTTL